MRGKNYVWPEELRECSHLDSHLQTLWLTCAECHLVTHKPSRISIQSHTLPLTSVLVTNTSYSIQLQPQAVAPQILFPCRCTHICRSPACKKPIKFLFIQYGYAATVLQGHKCFIANRPENSIIKQALLTHAWLQRRVGTLTPIRRVRGMDRASGGM